jgi:DNA ligase D-like protein (predicted 3'-phosphoesterase)
MEAAMLKNKPETGKRSKGRFVVQEHHARNLHWDFRLELDGVLKSWAVPKEPPLQPNVRRLAIQVEDHPLDYIDFEGVISEGLYGAGAVKIWDSGTFQIESRKPEKMVFTLTGMKMLGGYVLLRFKEENQWLFFKRKE